MPPQAAIQTRMRNIRIEELARHRQQVIQGQEQGFTQLDDDPFLGRREGRLQAMGTMRRILTVITAPPLAYRGAVQVVLAGQFAL